MIPAALAILAALGAEPECWTDNTHAGRVQVCNHHDGSAFVCVWAADGAHACWVEHQRLPERWAQ